MSAKRKEETDEVSSFSFIADIYANALQGCRRQGVGDYEEIPPSP
jgi:hypothetical protein